MFGLRGLLAVGVAASVIVSGSPAGATTAPLLYESFENCVHDDSPGYTNVDASLDSPMTVDLWYNDPTECDGWSFSGQAWLTQWVSGTPFADGEFAMWLNENPQGQAAIDLSGLEMGTEYTISFDAWTDNDPRPTWLEVSYFGAGSMPTWHYDFEGGDGPTHFEQTFTPDVESTTFFFIANGGSDASPIIDNICIGVDGCGDDDVVYKDALAQTGFDVRPVAGVAVFAMAVGAVALSRRRSRR